MNGDTNGGNSGDLRRDRRRNRRHPKQNNIVGTTGLSSTTKTTAAVAATAVVAYGAYRWYNNSSNNNKNDEDDAEQNEVVSGIQAEEEEQQPSRRNSRPLPESSSSSPSWLSSATNWAADKATSYMIQAAAAGIAYSMGLPDDSPSNDEGWSHTANSSHPTTSNTRRQQRQQKHFQPVLSYHQRRKLRIVDCRQKTIKAFHNCLPSLRMVIEQQTDTSHWTKQLKTLRQKQRERSSPSSHKSNHRNLCRQDEELRLWQRIMVETVTRMLASSYAYTLLLLSLTVQFHYVGYKLMIQEEDENSLNDQEGDDDDEVAILNPIQEEAQTLLLESHTYMVEDGLPLLISTIRRTVQNVLLSEDDDHDDDDDYDSGDEGDEDQMKSGWTDPTNLLTVQQIDDVLYYQIANELNYSTSSSSSSSSSSRNNSRNNSRNIRQGGSSRQRHRRARAPRRRNWMRFVWPEPSNDSMDELWDIGQSPVWEDAQQQVLERIWYDTMRDQGWINVFQKADDVNGKRTIQKKSSTTDNVGQPMAKVLAQFKKASMLVFDKAVVPNDTTNSDSSLHTHTTGSLADRLQRLPTVLELGDVSFGDEE